MRVWETDLRKEAIPKGTVLHCSRSVRGQSFISLIGELWWNAEKHSFQLEACSALAEDQSLVPEPLLDSFQPPVTPTQYIWCPILASCVRGMYMMLIGIDIDAGKITIHIERNHFCFKAKHGGMHLSTENWGNGDRPTWGSLASLVSELHVPLKDLSQSTRWTAPEGQHPRLTFVLCTREHILTYIPVPTYEHIRLLGGIAHTCNLSTWETPAGRPLSLRWDDLYRHSKFQTSQDYIARHCLPTTNKPTGNELQHQAIPPNVVL